MCGITGIFAFNPIGRMHLIHLEAATQSLSKRGPDAHGTWFDHTVGLGHRRLSIIDTSTGANQPFADVSGRYQIVFNGEIYNFKSLRNELLIKGFVFRSSSDTEVLLYAYMAWGADCLGRLNGFFAFAIYDSERRELFVARDRYGIKPLYIFQDEDKVLFASEVKALYQFGIPRKIDKLGLHLYFQHTYIPAPYSILEGVKKLQQGHYLVINAAGVTDHVYYEIPVIPAENPDFDQTKSDLVEAMRASVLRRLVADVPLGAFLSGGIDSSIIVALASEQVTNFKTFSIGFRDHAYFDETQYASLVADRYRTDHHEIKLTNEDLLGEVDHMLNYLDEPFADSSALPVYLLSKYTQKHVKVALSGDGADEVFSGYNKHSAWLMSQRQSMPTQLVAALGPLWALLPKSRGNFVTDRVRQLDRFVMIARLSPEDRYWALASFMGLGAIKKLLNPGFQLKEGELRHFQSSFAPFQTDSLSETLLRDCHMVLEGDMLAKVDRMSMAHGLEVRVPFLDPEVVRLAFSLPDHFKTVGQSRKIILREAFKTYLPEALYARPKHGFEVPLLPWFKKELKATLDHKVFNRERVESQGIFNWDEVSQLQKRMNGYNPGDVHIQIWSLLVFQNWYDRYFSS